MSVAEIVFATLESLVDGFACLKLRAFEDGTFFDCGGFLFFVADEVYGQSGAK